MKLSVKILLGTLIITQANAAEEMICGTKIYAKTEEEAKQKATASLAMSINSKITYNSTNEETIDGRKSSQKDIVVQNVDSKLLNAQAVKYENESSYNEFSCKACMLTKDAAKPYLNDSKEQTGKLKNAVFSLIEKNEKKEAWENVVTIYKKLKDLEGILIPLGQMDTSLQRKYEVDYDKAENEYKSYISHLKKGIYIENSNSDFESKISSFLADYGCVLAEKEMAASHLKFDVKECDKQMDGKFAFCKACIKMELSGKITYKYHFVSQKEGWTDMEKACKNAQENSTIEIWNKLREQINKGGCK